MITTGKAIQTAQEMERYKIEILGLSEVRWKGVGEIELENGAKIIYSGRTEETAKHEQGVAFMISKQCKKSLIEWIAISERIIVARFKARVFNICIFNIYAPTNEKTKEEKEDFYDELQKVQDETRKKHKRDIFIMIGDMNAKIGADNRGREEIMGKEALGIINENGELFVDFCANNNYVIGGSLFVLKDIHKGTWSTPDQ